MAKRVFLSTMWDLYFLWKFEWKEIIPPYRFEEQIISHLSFLIRKGDEVPDIKEPIKELYSYLTLLPSCNCCKEKEEFVEKYSKIV